MPLLGWPLLVTLGLATVVCTGLTLLLWSRVRGPAPARAGQRVGLVVVGQLTAVLLVAAALNDYGYFYGSWSELFGPSVSGGTAIVHAAAAHVARHHDGLPRERTVVASLAGVDSWSAPSQWATRGRVEGVTLAGPHSGLSEPAAVYLPPQYYQKAYAGKTFPAVEVLTGFPGAAGALVTRMQYPDVLLSQIDSHRAKPMVLVMLRPTVAPPRDTECTDVPAGPQALTFLAADVPEVVAASYRVSPRGWGAVGASTGGYCAAKLAMVHSETFSAAATLSGYFRTLQDRTTGDLWGGSEVVRDLNDLEWRIQHLPAPPVSLLVTTARDEAGISGYAASRRFLDLAASTGGAMRVYSLVAERGGHNFGTWAAHLPRALAWLSSSLPSPKAPS
jgi:enterochelin esterase-like enzyme